MIRCINMNEQTTLEGHTIDIQNCSMCGTDISNMREYFGRKRITCGSKVCIKDAQKNTSNKCNMTNTKRMKVLAYIILTQGIFKCANPQCTSIEGNVDHLTFGHKYNSGRVVPTEPKHIASFPWWVINNQHWVDQWVQLECYNCNYSQNRYT